MHNFKKVAAFYSVVFILLLGFDVGRACAQMNSPSPNKSETYKLIGKVIDSNTGDVIAQADVTVPGTDKAQTTDENGSFTFEDLPGGELTIKVEAQGYQTWNRKVTLSRDSQLTIELKPIE